MARTSPIPLRRIYDDEYLCPVQTLGALGFEQKSREQMMELTEECSHKLIQHMSSIFGNPFLFSFYPL